MVASKTPGPAGAGAALVDAVAQALAPDGALARAWPDWRPRAAQSAMAQAVAEALDGGGALLVEAPAGSGKTIAYLLPWLLSGRRALISTSTHVLQRQLADRDLPRLAAALGRPLGVAVLKGRGRYVCLARLQAAVAQGPRVGAAVEHRWLRELLAWAEADPEGDLDRVAGVDTVASLHARISSTHDNCRGMACARWSDCRVERARRTAQQAEVLVINHHVWLAELQRRERGRPGLLPAVDLVVFDEAHALHALRARLGAEVLDRAALQVFWSDLAALGDSALKGLQPWGLYAHDGQAATRALDQALQAGLQREGRQPWPLQDPAPSWRLAHALASARQALLACRGAEPLAARLWERTQGPAQVLHALLSAPGGAPSDEPAPAPVWLDWPSREAWSAVRPALRDEAALAQALATAAPLGAACVVHTSATLGHSEELSWHREALALGAPWSPRTLRLSEPGDPQASALFVG